MPHDHPMLPNAKLLRLAELRLSREGDDVMVDAYFQGPGHELTHLAFVGVKDLRVAKYQPEARGYQLLDVRDLGKRGRAVRLVPPKGKGVALEARVVMSVD